MSIALYHLADCADCEKVRLALELESLGYESLVIDPDDRREVREISGQTSVPVLVESDGSVLFVAKRILHNLAMAEGSRLLPASRRDQALTWVLADRADAILGPLCRSLTESRHADGSRLREDDLRVIRRRVQEEIAVLEGILERGSFLFGERPTIADVVAHAHLSRIPDELLQELLGEYPRSRGWHRRVLQAAGRVPAVEKT